MVSTSFVWRYQHQIRPGNFATEGQNDCLFYERAAGFKKRKKVTFAIFVVLRFRTKKESPLFFQGEEMKNHYVHVYLENEKHFSSICLSIE